MMPIYRFDVITRDGRRLVDEVGTMLPDEVAAEREAIESIADLTRSSAKNWLGCRFQVIGSDGCVLDFDFDDVLTTAVSRMPKCRDGGAALSSR